jgi:N-acetylglucosaminyldiphosphoundecaprenol N-acetyl-beta-D-mannosaminyltransferase
VHFMNVHMLAEAGRDAEFGAIIQCADLNFTDGMPLVWLARRANRGRDISQVCGPDFMPAFCKETARFHFRHFFYGGLPGVAEEVVRALKKTSPELEVVGYHCPPYGDKLSVEEDREICRMINESRADLVWVCLGCPVQERWLHRHRDKLTAPVLLAVGAAFDFTAGRLDRAPPLLRSAGLEWMYRLLKEPHRLWRRYLLSNSRFFYLLMKEKFH